MSHGAFKQRVLGIVAFAAAWLIAAAYTTAAAHAADMAQAITKARPSVVGVGTYMKTRSPSFTLMGTGFVVGDGLHVVTNAHTYAKPLDSANLEVPMIALLAGAEAQLREAQIIAVDRQYDLALLRLSGTPLAAMALGDSANLREGQMLAFTGFPIGLVLGLYPATHRAMVSALVPAALPGITARTLDERAIARLRDGAYRIIQLDGTAFPGNSGSPLYDPEDGAVYGVVNAVFAQAGREKAIGLPSGITYAIPSRFIIELLRREKIRGF